MAAVRTPHCEPGRTASILRATAVHVLVQGMQLCMNRTDVFEIMYLRIWFVF